MKLNFLSRMYPDVGSHAGGAVEVTLNPKL